MVVSGGGIGVSRFCRLVHLEITSAITVDGMGDRGVAGGKLRGAGGYAEDDWLAGGQPGAGNETSSEIFRAQFLGDVRDRSVFGDDAPGTVARAGAATICELPGVLCVAAGGIEFPGDESISAGVWRESRTSGVVGGFVVWGAALAESGAGADYIRGRSGDGVAVRERAEYFAAGLWAGSAGIVDLVGVPAGVAPFDEGGAAVLGVSGEIVEETRKVEMYESEKVKPYNVRRR
jgi:hypothetical protein